VVPTTNVGAPVVVVLMMYDPGVVSESVPRDANALGSSGPAKAVVGAKNPATIAIVAPIRRNPHTILGLLAKGLSRDSRHPITPLV
jgi:hypothetical protein